MKIVLINVSGQLSSDGSRLISALLKRAGHQVKSVFFARQEPLEYEPRELELLDEILKETDLVMLAVYSSYSIRAVQVTEYVHKRYPGLKVIWGGPHCISVPDLVLRYADGVCYSEGDQVVLDFVNKMESGKNYLNTPNMAFNVNGSQVVNDVLPPFSDLDSLPYYDYSLENQFLLDHKLSPLTKEKLRERHAGYPYYVPMLYTLTSRGCPNKCSYCNNCRYVTMFGHNSMRFHSVDRVIEELEFILGQFDFFRLIGFADDDFFMRPTEQLEDFAIKYKSRVGLPFGVALSAKTYSKEKLEILLDSGLMLVQMGVQSGSQRILDEVYNRKIQVQKTKQVIRQIAPYKKTHGLELLLDFIIDNPYETKNDIMKTYRYLVDLPADIKVNLFSLAFFPGTPIYERAFQDGIIESFSEKTFRFYTRSNIRYQQNYETFLILFLRFLRSNPALRAYIPKFIMRALGTGPARAVASIFPKKFYSLLCKRIQKVPKQRLTPMRAQADHICKSSRTEPQ